MKRRIIGIVAALLLATVGTLVLVSYVESARDEARADERLATVWVVDEEIAVGADEDTVAASTRQEEVPAKLVADDAISELHEIKGLVTSVALKPGEQLLSSRFVTAEEAARGDVPPGLLQVTVSLDPERALGGKIAPGDTVAVLLSFEAVDSNLPAAIAQNFPAKVPDRTHLELHKVLVTEVQAEEVLEQNSSDEDQSLAPTRNLLVTLATDGPAIEQIVFAAEFGTIWLADEPADANEDGTRLVTPDNVYESLGTWLNELFRRWGDLP